MTQVRNINFYLICSLSFCLPLFQHLTPLIAILVWVSSLFFKNNYAAVLKNKTVISLLIFHVLYCLGMIYTDNNQQGLFNLQVKLSLLLFPFVLIPILEFDREKTRTVFSFFIYGCLTACAICFLLATYRYIEEKWLISQHLYNLNYGINFFLSSRLSYFMHPSYFAMYLAFSIILLIYSKELGLYFSNRVLNLLLITFSITVFFLASKAGIIIYFLIAVFYFIKNKKTKLALVFFGIIVALFFILFAIAPEFANKFRGVAKAVTEKNVESNATESSSARVLVWQSAVEVISSHPFWGTGTGDSQEELQKIYEKKGYTGVLEKKLNLHNQFLETFVTIGIPGLMALLLILYFGISFFYANKNYAGIFLILIISINFLFESMLETQAGTLFFAFWLIVLLYSKSSNSIDEQKLSL